MTVFGPKPWVNPLEKCQFFDFLDCCFYSLERRFFVLEYQKRHFPGLYWLKKKKLGNWPFLDQNHGLTPLEKFQFFDFLNLLFLQSKKAIFRQKPWVNPFGKMSIFRLFELFVFTGYKGVFSMQNIVKDIFLAYIA